MARKFGRWVAAGVAVVCLAVQVAAMDNPIAATVEGSVVRYGGQYHTLGAGTNHMVLTSVDLVAWNTNGPALPAPARGPFDLLYRNGLFYLYAQDQGLAFSPDPLAPFSKFAKTGVAGEQLRLYPDLDGTLLSIYRKLGSKEEGEIWMQPYAAPWQVAGRPKQLLDGRRGMWDSLDSADLGEPDLLHYRGNYYLLYCANHPGPRTGLREVGVAVQERIDRLENADKAANPVLARNTERLARTYGALLPNAEFGKWEARYTFDEPEGDWLAPDYKYSGWRTGDGGFGFPFEVEDSTQLHACRTRWSEGSIWVRREFSLDGNRMPKTPVLNLRHEGPVRVYLNGRFIHESKSPSTAYCNIDISDAAYGAFRQGANVLAVQSSALPGFPYRFLDFGLSDAGDQPVEPAVYGLDEPCLVEGPNGFEHWLLYQAWWNGRPGTGLDRVFFYDAQMVVDGPTTAATPGYHPPPARPTFSDRFADGISAWTGRWKPSAGEWMATNGVLRQAAPQGAAKAYLGQSPATHYLFETSFRMPPEGKGSVGVVAWSDGKRDLVIAIQPAARSWSFHVEPGSLLPKRYRLPAGFKLAEAPPRAEAPSAPLHRLRIMKNGGNFEVLLDGALLTAERPLVTELAGPGVPGLYCADSVAEFDGVTFTAGWDEFNETINAWGAAADGTPVGGEWKHDPAAGLEQRRHSETGRAFKGDLLDQYEFCVSARLEELEEGKERLYGIFPVFANRDNYLQAMIDTRERKLLVTGRLGGRAIAPLERPLARSIPVRHLYDTETSYRNIAAWVFPLRSESLVSGLSIRWLEGKFEHLRQEFFVPGDDLVVRYANLEPERDPILWSDSRFYKADEPKPQIQQPGILNPIAIRPQKANYMGFGLFRSTIFVADADTGRFLRPYTPGETLGPNEAIGGSTYESDTPSRPQETLIHVEVESSYFFRCVKLADRVLIELNGVPMAVVPGAWPPSQVGLVTEGQPCIYNGMTLMHLPAE